MRIRCNILWFADIRRDYLERLVEISGLVEISNQLHRRNLSISDESCRTKVFLTAT